MSGDMTYFKNEIKEIKDILKDMNGNIKDNGKQINDLKVGFSVLRTDYCGESGSNGLKGQVKKNSEAIKEIKKTPSNFLKNYIPLIITVVLFLSVATGWIKEWVKASAKSEATKTEIITTPDNVNP